jgi:hypothetical protein
MLKLDYKAVSMAVSNWQLNRFERLLFRVALAVAVLLVAVRVGAVLAVWYLHHPH